MATASTPTTHYGKKLVGPFSGDQKPDKDGLFPRVSPKTGALLFAWYSRANGWSKYASCPARALELKGTRSRHPRLRWYGFTKTGN